MPVESSNCVSSGWKTTDFTYMTSIRKGNLGMLATHDRTPKHGMRRIVCSCTVSPFIVTRSPADVHGAGLEAVEC
jgi:hypothetical protein